MDLIIVEDFGLFSMSVASNSYSCFESHTLRISPGKPPNFHGPEETGISVVNHAVYLLPKYCVTAFWHV